jgi:SAM-dependent methyltransferase
MTRHVYQNSSAVAAYDRSHGLRPDGAENDVGAGAVQLRDEVVEGIVGAFSDRRAISVLDIGVGNGRWVFLPLLRRLLSAAGPPGLAVAVGVDNSIDMLARLEAELESVAGANTEVRKRSAEWWGVDPTTRDRPVITTALGDIEAEVVERVGRKPDRPGFDVIVLMGVLHHTLSWRVVVDAVVRHLLAPGGILVLSERDADSAFLDGNAYEDRRPGGTQETEPAAGSDREAWRRLWRSYYAERAAWGSPWEPEIRASDMSAVIANLEFRGIRSIDGWPRLGKWPAIYAVDEVKRWMNPDDPAFSNFHRHLRRLDELAALAKARVKVEEAETESTALNDVVDDAMQGRAQYAVVEGWRFHLLRSS